MKDPGTAAQQHSAPIVIMNEKRPRKKDATSKRNKKSSRRNMVDNSNCATESLDSCHPDARTDFNSLNKGFNSSCRASQQRSTVLNDSYTDRCISSRDLSYRGLETTETAPSASTTDDPITECTCAEHCRHNREKDELLTRNMELERELHEARRTIHAHEERLVMYSQMIKTHNLSPKPKPIYHPTAAAGWTQNRSSSADSVSIRRCDGSTRAGRCALSADSINSKLNSLKNDFSYSKQYAELIVVPR